MKKMPAVSNSRMICLLLAFAIHAVALWGSSDGGLEITPHTLLVNSEHGNLERQSDEKATTMATFTCVGIPPNKIPRQLEVVWMKDGLVIETVGTKKYLHHRRKKQLVIKKLDETDSGRYECAISSNSTEKGMAELWISPHIISAPSPQLVPRASPSAAVECQVTGGRRTVDWWKNQLQIASSDPAVGNTDPRYTVSDTGSLLISSVTRNDKGSYTCIARNPAGRVEKHVRVRVTNPITPTSEPTTTEPYRTLPPPRNLSHCVEYNDIRFGGDLPFVNLTSSLSGGSSGPRLTAVPHACVQTRLAYRIVLSCVGTGSPTPSLSWTKDGQPIPEGTTDNHYIQLSNGSLLITTVELSDAGRYTCTASSSHGNVASEVQLEVRSTAEQCGVKGYWHDNDERVKRIVRGFAVSGIHQWPWQVLIEYEEDPTTSLLDPVFCGGALVRPGWIVTAAHCLYTWSNQLRPVDSLVVRTGVHNRTHGSEVHQQILKAHRYIIHPSYNPHQVEHDIALIQLSQPVRPSPQVGTVCLPPQAQDPPVGSVCTVTGWGTLQHRVNNYPELLHQGDVPLVSATDCTSRESYRRKVTDNMLCAGWREGGADSCQNDSGGPLVCEVPGNEGRWALYGIVNFGEGCGVAHKYGVYSRVTQYLSWIDTVMGSS